MLGPCHHRWHWHGVRRHHGDTDTRCGWVWRGVAEPVLRQRADVNSHISRGVSAAPTPATARVLTGHTWCKAPTCTMWKSRETLPTQVPDAPLKSPSATRAHPTVQPAHLTELEPELRVPCGLYPPAALVGGAQVGLNCTTSTPTPSTTWPVSPGWTCRPWSCCFNAWCSNHDAHHHIKGPD